MNNRFILDLFFCLVRKAIGSCLLLQVIKRKSNEAKFVTMFDNENIDDDDDYSLLLLFLVVIVIVIVIVIVAATVCDCFRF